MTNQKEFREEALKANGVQPHGISEEDRKILGYIIRRDKARLRWMKWAIVIFWGLWLLCWLAIATASLTSVGKGVRVDPQLAVILVPPSLLLLAVVCTISYAIRTWVARGRESQYQMAELEARLARMEEAIKRLTERG